MNNENFTALMECFKLIPTENKRLEVINKIEQMISNLTDACLKIGRVPNLSLNKEMLNISRNDLSEDEMLCALFSYLNTLQEINAQVINVVCEYLEKKGETENE